MCVYVGMTETYVTMMTLEGVIESTQVCVYVWGFIHLYGCVCVGAADLYLRACGGVAE